MKRKKVFQNVNIKLTSELLKAIMTYEVLKTGMNYELLKIRDNFFAKKINTKIKKFWFQNKALR